MQAESTRNASSPTHTTMTSQTPVRGPSPKMADERPPVREYQHHKKAMITSSTQATRSPSSSPDIVRSPMSILTHTTPYRSSSDTEVMSPDSGMSSASSSPETPMTDDNNNTTHTRPLVNCTGTPLAALPADDNNNTMLTRPPVTSTGTPLAPLPNGPPVKRRPGRPPGSTKKFKNPYAREYRRKSDSDNSNDFSLRKFFEAGGRDYNEYLEWLKKKGQTPSNGMQPTPASVAPQFSTMTQTPASPAVQSYPRAPMYPTTPVSVHQGQVRPAPGPQSPLPVQIPSVSQVSPPLVHGPGQAPSPQMLPPGYRPILIPRTPLPPGVRPGEMMPFVPGFTMVPIPGQPSIPSQHPMPTQPSVQPPAQKSPTTPNKDVFSALDLSAKRRHHEHDMQAPPLRDLNNSDRLHHDVYHVRHLVKQEEHPHHQQAQFQRDLMKESRIDSRISEMRIPEREEPTSPTKIPSDEVESSTPEVDLSSWDIENVVKFVTSVPGCTEYADTFREHKIDGATLPHLSESHLLNFVKMKLGPAIRLRLAISRLKSAS